MENKTKTKELSSLELRIWFRKKQKINIQNIKTTTSYACSKDINIIINIVLATLFSLSSSALSSLYLKGRGCEEGGAK